MGETEMADAPLEEKVQDDSAKLSAIETYEVERAAARRQWFRDYKRHRQELRQALTQEKVMHEAAGDVRFVDDEIKERERSSVARKEVEHQAFLAAIIGGSDSLSWVAPKDGVVSDELLGDHLAQLRNLVRYALSLAIDDETLVQQRLSAANTATRMIRANIALARELKASKSKTVRGGKRGARTQD